MRYYCHLCHTQIREEDLLPGHLCPSCQSGFVEEIPVQAPRRSSSVDESNRNISDDFVSGLARYSDDLSDDNSDIDLFDTNGPIAQVIGLFQSHQQQQQQNPSTTIASETARQSSQQLNQQQGSNSSNPSNSTNNQAQATRISTRSTSRNPGGGVLGPTYTDPSTNSSLAEVLNDFITGVSFGTHFPEGTSSGQGSQSSSGSGTNPVSGNLINFELPLPLFLHSNPGDYAWGNAGFDAVITQLLNNLDGSNSGPPPMPKDQIDGLPTVKISDDQLKGNNSQCNVCMEDFQVGDAARRLPCEHFFHQDCIVPWLNLHASCPICRKTFATGSSSQNSHSEASDENQSLNRNSVQNTEGRGTNRSNSSATVTNQNVRPDYDLTEDDCD